MELTMNTLVEYKLTPDEYVYLYYLVNNKLCPVTVKINHKSLEEKQFIKILHNKTIARQKTINLFKNNISNKDSAEKQIAKAVINSKKLLNDVENWIDSWRDLFPAGVKTAGYRVKGTRGGCIKKMKSFIKANEGVSKEQIFTATKTYIAEKAMVRYQYMKIADYFISKDGASLLESYIELSIINAHQKKTEEFDSSTNNLADDI